MNTSKPLEHCPYCLVENGRHEDQCMITLRGCTTDDVPIETAYRRGVHQAFAMLDDWLNDHPNVDVRDLVHQARCLARTARSDRGPRDWLMNDLLDRLEPETLTSTPLERIRDLIRQAEYSAEHGRRNDRLMEDVCPDAETLEGTRVGYLVYNALSNLREAINAIVN